jgi:5'-nucleotidase
MRLLIDMDGVVANFLEHFCYLFNRRYLRNVQPDSITTFDLSKSIEGATREECNTIFKSPGFFDNLLPVDGAIEALNSLEDKGHEIVFVTSCYTGHEDKLNWLNRHLDFVPTVVFCNNKYLVKGDILLDDSIDNLEQWANEWVHNHAVCFDAPYNQAWNGKTVKNWNEFQELVDRLS